MNFREMEKISIFKDGRANLEQLYSEFEKLTAYGFSKEIIYQIEIEGVMVPVYAYVSKMKGEAAWLFAGIHGEEPAGVNAIAREIESIGQSGKEIPIVVIPLLNPAGYYRNWRFHNIERSPHRLNVTDSRHLITNGKEKFPELLGPVHTVAGKVTEYILDLMEKYPPELYIDLHEDEQLFEGYIYSQGEAAGEDLIAQEVIKILTAAGVPLVKEGKTRFAHEYIHNGVVADDEGRPVHDGSVDDLLASPVYYMKGKWHNKPYAKSAIVVETPTLGGLTLEDRIKAHQEVIKNLKMLWGMIK